MHSKDRLGAVLLQEGKPVALINAETRYTQTEKEFLAIVLLVKSFIVIYMDG